jgi:outer membrane receptor protein involved in Fe transport
MSLCEEAKISQYLIDGRPTIMNGQDLLKQLPAASIEQIEIITNPSAKYDPDGTAGIINVIMKKDSYGGLNGLISLSAGLRDKYTGSANMNYKEQDYNLFASLSYNDQMSYPYSSFTRETFSGDTTYYIQPIMNRVYHPNNYSVNGGIDYNLNEDDVLSLSASYGYYGFDRILPSDYTEWTNYTTANTYYTNSDDYKYGGNYTSADLNYNVNFEDEGHKLQSHISLSDWNGNINGVSTKYNTNELFNEKQDILNSHRNNTDNGSNKLLMKIDHTLPLNDASVLELGYNGDLVWKNIDFLYEDYDISDKLWQTNFDYTNDSKYRQNIQSVYATYSGDILDFQYKLGLRAEYYFRILDQITINEKYEYDEYNLFPSLHISKEIAEGHQLQFGYSRRVQRPDDRILNPFADYVDDYYVSQGNPYLKPQFTDSYELNYRMNFERSFLSLETYYRNTNDMFARKSTLMDNGKLLLTFENINRNYLYGTELAANITFAQWLRVYASTNFYRYYLVEMLGDKEQNRVSNIADFNASATITVTPYTFIQLNAYYTGPRIIADGEMEDF